jgi:hypothetical protein
VDDPDTGFGQLCRHPGGIGIYYLPNKQLITNTDDLSIHFLDSC